MITSQSAITCWGRVLPAAIPAFSLGVGDLYRSGLRLAANAGLSAGTRPSQVIADCDGTNVERCDG